MWTPVEYAKHRFNLYFQDGVWSGPKDGEIPVMLVDGEEVYAADVALAIAYDDDSLDRSADSGWDYIFDVCELGDDIDPRWVQALYVLHCQKTFEAMAEEIVALALNKSQPWKFDNNADAEPLLAPVGRWLVRLAKYVAKHAKIAVDRSWYRG